MDSVVQKQCAALLRAAANQTIKELDFWDQFKKLEHPPNDQFINIAYESAIHYWGNFHGRSILFLIPLKPDRYQLQQGQDELNLIADGLEGNWPISELKRKLDDI